MCSPSWNPLHLPPHPIPQCYRSAPALSTLSHGSNLDWLSISHMVTYMFQCYSFKSSHSRLLPRSPKVCSSLLFKIFIYFNWRLITLQYCSGFCHTLTWISHVCTCGPHPEPLCHLPPHPIPRGCPSAPALSAMFHAMNLDWSSISHMVIYMFQSYSFKPSQPRLLPRSPKVCSLHLCLFCCLAYTVMITIFLNFIYMH